MGIKSQLVFQKRDFHLQTANPSLTSRAVIFPSQSQPQSSYKQWTIRSRISFLTQRSWNTYKIKNQFGILIWWFFFFFVACALIDITTVYTTSSSSSSSQESSSSSSLSMPFLLATIGQTCPKLVKKVDNTIYWVKLYLAEYALKKLDCKPALSKETVKIYQWNGNPMTR